jgi:predicted DNA-binding transcriptional regulator YafY
VLADIERVTTREFYHPAGSVQSFSIAVGSDRVRLHSGRDFRRPVRLNAREALALSLGLRVLASDADAAAAARIVALAERLEKELASPAEDELVAERTPAADATAAVRRAGGTGDAAADVEYDREAEAQLRFDFGSDDARGVLTEAIEAHRRCTVSYIRPGDAAPADRRVEPLLLVHHAGFWYLVAHDVERDGRRVFRLDRMLGVRMDDETFAAPADLDIGAFFRDGVGPFLSERDDVVVVRYSPRIARWIAERTAAAEREPDGSVLVRHRVADARWIVRHVLQYAGDAEVIDAPAYRRLVAETAGRLAS